MLHADATRLLRTWAAPDAEQAATRDSYLRHLSAEPAAMWRDGPRDHMTASVVVLDHRLERVLLTLHKKARLWLQLGGHLEPADGTVHAAAAREAREESGIEDLDVRPRLAQLHHHQLTASFGHCRSHLDLRFVAVAAPGAEPVISEESEDLRWWPVDRLPQPTDPDMGDLVSAARAALS
ncbi:hypothetical protein VV02_20050 [Luteipulveratus mongoliensis]|uniref:Nudix hydrolase domain-containing protein n=1 Tax=Luteipulveratus mongoliensis TaxID=571913 RepID=A0A0K1JRE7_9MICO|nr:hypothetical protein VV02_20050 [Luteipulveratus mongoliensis]